MAKDKNGLRLGQQKGTTKSATGSTDPHSVDEAAELDYVMISPATGEALGTSQFRLSDHTLFLNHFSAHSLSAKDVNGAANVKPSANESKLDKRAIIPSDRGGASAHDQAKGSDGEAHAKSILSRDHRRSNPRNTRIANHLDQQAYQQAPPKSRFSPGAVMDFVKENPLTCGEAFKHLGFP
jgi:hypothetical protein